MKNSTTSIDFFRGEVGQLLFGLYRYLQMIGNENAAETTDYYDDVRLAFSVTLN